MDHDRKNYFSSFYIIGFLKFSLGQLVGSPPQSFGTPQKKYLAELEKSKPKLISMLEGIDKKARIEEKNKSIGKEFVW